MGDEAGRPGGRALTEAGVRHVRLAYQYLDEGDLDGYASLVASEAVSHPRVGGRHDVQGVLREPGRVSAIGTWAPGSGDPPVPFVDGFDVSADGLLLTRCAGTDRPPRRTPP